jgi:hypothetical protein
LLLKSLRSIIHRQVLQRITNHFEAGEEARAFEPKEQESEEEPLESRHFWSTLTARKKPFGRFDLA